MPDTLEAYHEQVEEQVRGNYDISERNAKLLCEERKKTINIRFRRGQSVRITAEEVAALGKFEALPHDWRP